MADNLPDMPMKATTVRFGPVQWRFIARQAEAEGVSTSQFVRDAAFGRAILQWAANANPDELATMRAILAGEPTQEELGHLLERITPTMYDEGDTPS